MSEKTSVIIIGGGAAGITVATTLDKSAANSLDVTLITEKDYLRHHPASLRAIVTSEGELEKHIVASYDKIFGKDKKGGSGRIGKVKVGKVTSVEETEDGGFVHLEGGERLHYDYLVVASGSFWNGPLLWPSRAEDIPEYLDNWREKFASAKSIVLAGAGAVGTELAGEIKDFYPQTELTVVQRDKLPLNSTYPDAFRQRLAHDLEARGIRVLLGDSLDLPQNVLDGTDPVTPGRKITTAKGVTVPAELIIPTGGRRGVNTDFLRSSSSFSQALDEGGYVKVTKTLQVAGHPHVFAAGDVVALPEQHTLIKASAHGPLIANNILTLIGAGKKGGKLGEYVKPTDSILVTNGRTRGALYVDLFTFFGRPVIFGNWLSSTLKSKGLLVSMFKGLMNTN